MTLRDYFAGQALAGLCANSGLVTPNPNHGWITLETSKNIAGVASMIADAMLAERGKAE
jgi:hypothetical protein